MASSDPRRKRCVHKSLRFRLWGENLTLLAIMGEHVANKSSPIVEPPLRFYSCFNRLRREVNDFAGKKRRLLPKIGWQKQQKKPGC